MAEKPQSNWLIAMFVRHPTAANLLMAIMVLAGIFAVGRINVQFFPTINIPNVTVSIVWPGASAKDVETNILDALEPSLRFIDGLEEASSVAREGVGRVALEFKTGTDMQRAISEIEQAVAATTTLPEDAEEPVIKRVSHFEPVANISVSGPFPETTIKSYAKIVRDGLLAAGIDRVDMNGVRSEEIWVRISEFDLRRLDLSLADVAAKVKDNSRDLPSGRLEGAVEMQLRALSRRKTPERLAQIEVRSNENGDKVRLGDVATIEPRFDRDALIGRKSGSTAIELRVRRAVTADTLETLDRLNKFLEKIKPSLPPGLEVVKYHVTGDSVVKRLGILVKNGLGGLVLVLAVLFLFLNARIAFWVALGIPIALMATLAVMYMSGQTINMVSMFALIMMLGIIVDDAIVVGEHTARRQELGDSRLEAAERGAARMFRPVMAATLTTQAAFLPILLIRDRIGDIMGALPLVVMAVLTASIIECFLVLPGHLRHGFGKMQKQPSRFRRWFDGGFRRFNQGPYRRFIEFAFRWRYAVVAINVAMLFIAIGLIAGGRLSIRFFPSPEAERIMAFVEFGAGTPRARQTSVLQKLEETLKKTEKELTGGKGRLVVTNFSLLGVSGRTRGDNLAQMEVQLTASEDRTIPTKTIMKAWRRQLPKIAGVERITITKNRRGPSGRDVDVILRNAPVETLKAASNELREALTAFPGLSAISDDLPYGKRELIMELTPRGAAMGFTTSSVGVQVRNAFEGAIATRFARDDEEITVRILRKQETPGIHALRLLYLRSPDGQQIPLTEVVSISEKAGFSIIKRQEGVRSVSVTADIDPKVTTVPDVVDKLKADVMPALATKYALEYSFSGRSEERAKSFADLKTGSQLALAIIYIILAWLFGSYAKPLAVMGIIPFGIVGAIFGHMLLGYDLTIVSLIGILGLSGILVNDSIILVSQASSRLKEGQSMFEAAIGASQDRLRAVVLTSLTTIGGLLPLLFETSRQAQFLIPMVVTIIFGLAAATILVLILVPSLLGIGHDIGRMGNALKRLMFGPPLPDAGE